jgi:hypothetical protein
MIETAETDLLKVSADEFTEVSFYLKILEPKRLKR